MKGSGKPRSLFVFLAVAVLCALLIMPALAEGERGESKPGASIAAQNNPLTIDGDPLRITVMDDGTFGVFRNQEGTYVNQHYGNYAKGSVIWLNGGDTDYRWGGGSSSFILQPPDFVPVSHTQPDPWTIVTVYDAGESGVRVTETVTYTNGRPYYRVSWDIANTGDATFEDVRFFHGADTYFGGIDFSEGYWNDQMKMVYLRNPGLSGIMGFYAAGTTPSAHHMEGNYGLVGDQCMSGDHLPDTVDPNYLDAGYALEWTRATLAPGDTWTIVAYEKWTEAGDVQVYAPSDTDAFPGETVALPFNVQNFGPEGIFNLQATSAQGWPVSAPYSIELDEGEIAQVDVQVTIPWSAAPGTIGEVTLQATLSTDPEVTNDDTAVVNVLESPIPTWYMAEGCTKGGFETWILVQNPNDDPVQVNLAFDTGEGEVIVPELQGVELDPHTRASFNLNPHIETFDVATRVTSVGGPVVCERAMYGNLGDEGDLEQAEWAASANDMVFATESVGTIELSDLWYLAEGCSAGGFESWVLVQNPNDYDVRINMALHTDQGLLKPSVLQDLVMPAHTRASWNLAEYYQSYHVSVEVTSEVGPVVVERAMYGPGRGWGTASIGTPEASPFWFLAEGCTGEGFSTWVLVQNPLGVAQDVQLTFLTEQGEVEGPQAQVGPHSRITFNVADYVQSWDVSTLVTAEEVVAERSMYGEGWATCSVGAPMASPVWSFAEGCTAGGMETWILVENPLPDPVHVSFVLDTDTGQQLPPPLQGVEIPGSSRVSFLLNDYITTYDVSTLVVCEDGVVVCERAMYGPGRGWGTVSIGHFLFLF